MYPQPVQRLFNKPEAASHPISIVTGALRADLEETSLISFHQSLLNLTPSLPVSASMMFHFVAHLHASRLATASIVPEVSAVGYFHKTDGFADPSAGF